jgi:hypothetical protein
MGSVRPLRAAGRGKAHWASQKKHDDRFAAYLTGITVFG